MNAVLDAVGPAVWRASWQASVLGAVVWVLLRLLSDRVAARWRYVLWGVVVIRLLVVVTPASPWSAFHVARVVPDMFDGRAVLDGVTTETARAPDDRVFAGGRDEGASEGRVKAGGGLSGSLTTAPVVAGGEVIGAVDQSDHRWSLPRALSAIYLVGALWFAVAFVGAAVVLRRRLSGCREVTDPKVLEVMRRVCERMGIWQRVELLVTAEVISPCIVGTWRPRVILPETLVTESTPASLGHVLAHEMAHVRRGDLWTNWLLVLVRVVHWFNPVTWWVVREMRADREAACDELAVRAHGEGERGAYAMTLVDLAARLAPARIAPGMIGFFGPRGRLAERVERVVHGARRGGVWAGVAGGVFAAMVVFGLTDARSGVVGKVLDGAVAAVEKTVTLRGRCRDEMDRGAIVGAQVRLFKVEGRTGPLIEMAKVDTDGEGRFAFDRLAPARGNDPFDPLLYVAIVEAEDRPVAVGGMWFGNPGEEKAVDVGINREKTTLAGTVVDPQGRPLVGATVSQWDYEGRSIPGVLSAKTGVNGRFLINRISYFDRTRLGTGAPPSLSFTARHPDYPATEFQVQNLPKNVTVTMQAGCRVTGSVMDQVSGRPGVGVTVIAERLGEYGVRMASTDAAGRFAMVLPEDRYHFSVRVKDRVSAAIRDRDCDAGKLVELPPLVLTSGGWITGRVLNASTREPIAVTALEEPIAIGLIGPSYPVANGVTPLRLAFVDANGRFSIRAAAGENFPYLVNHRGDRMAWDTTTKPAVVVKEGGTTEYDMIVTPKREPAERLAAARKVIELLPKDRSERVERILVELRKVSQTVDDTELWCSLVKALVDVGPAAVPRVCEELDGTTENRSLRRLAFVLRAIGDKRGVPALIRAIPRTLLPASSDYGLVVADAGLAGFMQKHDLREGNQRGQYFHFGRPEREVFGTLRKLTGQSFDDDELMGLSLSEDPVRQWHQRRLFVRHAQRWATWWELHGRELTDDPAYRYVKLDVRDGAGPAMEAVFGPKSRVVGTMMGLVISPADQGGDYTVHFFDLDTGASPTWPARIARDEGRVDMEELSKWAEMNGVELMCVTHRGADGRETFVLRAFGMTVWEIGAREGRNLERSIRGGALPQGRVVGELLMHHDETLGRDVADANGVFVYRTREGSLGVIETTDRVTRTEDLTGQVGNPPAGVGYKRGVRMNLKEIVR